jgi:hypothetical protein
MATPHPSLDGGDRRAPRGRLARMVVSVLGLCAVVAAPVAAVSLWLLLTDPPTAAAVLESGDLLPLAQALMRAVGEALSAVLAYL